MSKARGLTERLFVSQEKASKIETAGFFSILVAKVVSIGRDVKKKAYSTREINFFFIQGRLSIDARIVLVYECCLLLFLNGDTNHRDDDSDKRNNADGSKNVATYLFRLGLFFRTADFPERLSSSRHELST